MKTFKELAKDVNSFFNTIMPSYLEQNVPDGTPYPYLTYILEQNGEYFSSTIISCKIYTRNTSVVPLLNEVDKLEQAIGQGTQYKNMWIYKGDPFSQFINDTQDIMLKQAYVNLVFRIY